MNDRLSVGLVVRWHLLELRRRNHLFEDSRVFKKWYVLVLLAASSGITHQLSRILLLCLILLLLLVSTAQEINRVLLLLLNRRLHSTSLWKGAGPCCMLKLMLMRLLLLYDPNILS